jgi:hypothetical protein
VAEDLSARAVPSAAPTDQVAPEAAAAEPRAGFIETARAVLWSFFGVRGRHGHERDLARLNPLYVILMGLLLAAALVLGLVALVKIVTS